MKGEPSASIVLQHVALRDAQPSTPRSVRTLNQSVRRIEHVDALIARHHLRDRIAAARARVQLEIGLA